MKTLLILVCFFCLQSRAWSDVWVDTQPWNDEWETKFSEWVKSKEVTKEMFVSKSSRYRGVVADCADVAYAFRAIFAYKNNLKFSAKNPMATATSTVKVLSNRMTRFDTITNPDRRLVAFLNYLGEILGSETLSANDSYPLKIDQIRPSDVFLYKVKKKNAFIRHNYNIKNIDPRGNFEVIYSTQAIRDARTAMIQRVVGLYHAPVAYKWGFRRYDYGVSADQSNSLKSRSAMSHEQYAMATKLGERGFFANVKAQLRQEIESPDAMMMGQLKEYCDQVKERIDVVNKGIAHRKALGGKCMEYADFDAHSTPSRDGRLKDIVSNLGQDYAELTQVQKGQLSGSTLEMMEALYSKSPSTSALASLAAFCPISYRADVQLNLRVLRLRISKGLLSSHPNDTTEIRWGEKTNGKTACKTFY